MDEMYTFCILYSFFVFKDDVLKCIYYDRKYNVCLLGFVKWFHKLLRNLFCNVLIIKGC
uniref:Uncharacterized protein n=1 Tax=Prolemur simus TaxID=1328070 RepID=A0A8C9AH96_PROSS